MSSPTKIISAFNETIVRHILGHLSDANDCLVMNYRYILQCYQLSYCVHDNSKSVTLDSINSKVFTVSKDILEVILLFSVFGILSRRLGLMRFGSLARALDDQLATISFEGFKECL